MNQASIEPRQSLARRKPLPGPLSAVQGYGLAALSVSAALGVSLLLSHYDFRDLADLLFVLAIAITSWYAAPGPAIFALVCSFLTVDYFFIEPIYSFRMTSEDIPHFIVFAIFALLVNRFAAVRRSVERELIQSRDQLETEVAERKRREREVSTLNEELSKRTTELEASNKELEAFAYSISHDLRAPLRHMTGFAELLHKNAASVLNEKNRRYLTMIMESAKRMGNLIDDLLAFSRIGRAEAHKAPVNLDQLLQDVLTEVRRDAEGRRIIWRIGALPAWYGDRSMLRLALVNLVSNAVKFTRTRPEAEIDIGCLEDRRDQIVLFIRDNGVGFDMKYVNKLFGVFQRLHPPEAFEGTGIGLATVQRIVHRHGGRVWAEGLVDRGATFYFALSRSQESES